MVCDMRCYSEVSVNNLLWCWLGGLVCLVVWLLLGVVVGFGAGVCVFFFCFGWMLFLFLVGCRLSSFSSVFRVVWYI